MKVAIIGGGASGLVASIYAKEKNNEVVVFEKNNICGKKILASGNGRCNFFNEDQNINHYHSKNEEILKEMITKENLKEVLHFFDRIGIIPKKKNGYYYPSSNQATSIQKTLLLEAKYKGVSFLMDKNVKNITNIENKFQVETEDQKYYFDKLILATGSNASLKQKTNGYQLAENLGHSIITPKPTLVQLKSSGKFLKKWAGIRCDVKISIYEENILKKEEEGEIQLTDYGVSGICVFNVSRIASIGIEKGKKINLSINFIPFIKENIKEFLNNFASNHPKRTIKEVLESILNCKLVDVLLEQASIPKEKKYMDLTKTEKNKLTQTLISFSIPIIDTKEMEFAQVSLGGVSIREINPNTMESKKIKNLYFAGELLDVDGDCGGYNLSFAFLSGIKAGKNIKKDVEE